MKPYLLKDVPEALWVALRADAASRETPERFSSGLPSKRKERTGTSLNNVVCEILAERYHTPFIPTNRATFDQSPTRRSLYLRLPLDSAEALREDAGDASLRSVILRTLAEHYGLELTPPPRRRVKHGRPRGRKALR